MERRAGTSIYALIGCAAVIVVALLVGALYWKAPGNGQSVAAPTLPVPVKSPPAMVHGGKVGQNAAPSGVKPLPASDKPVKQAEIFGNDVSGSGRNEPPEALAEPKPVQGELDSRPVPVQPEKTVNSKTASPSFDHVRIEPNGENVFAGRVTPGATVEMVLGGDVHARAVADTSGLFALVSPPLPVGASHIYLRSIAPDGQREISKQSVTVVISGDKTRRPLVVLASPDKPTVVLSNPDSPDKHKPDPGDAERLAAGKAGATRAEVRIAAIEARDGGRLNVSGQAAPGATVRLYINNVMVAPGGADSEGKVSFAIARGMEAGDYKVRLDDVDPVSGEVKSKAEVSFNIPRADKPLGPPPATAPKEGSAMTAGMQPDGSGVERMTVARGDSLWRISERRYGSGYLYLEVYDANMRKIKNPDVIYPGQVLILPPLETPRP